jgi:prepilin peptidase CpaA
MVIASPAIQTPLFPSHHTSAQNPEAIVNRHHRPADHYEGVTLGDRMLIYRLLTLLPMLALLIFAAAQDLRTRRIRNWLTLCLVVTGIAHSIMSAHSGAPWAMRPLTQSVTDSVTQSVTLGDSLLGTLAGFGLPLILFIMGALGGGDVKLLAGVGAWLGASGVIEVFLAAAIVGMVIVLVQCAAKGRLKLLFSNTYVLVLNILHIGELGVQQVAETGRTCRSVDRPLPYAVPVLVAVVLMVVVN